MFAAVSLQIFASSSLYSAFLLYFVYDIDLILSIYFVAMKLIEPVYIMEYLSYQEQELLSIVYREKGNSRPVKLLASVTSFGEKGMREGEWREPVKITGKLFVRLSRPLDQPLL